MNFKKIKNSFFVLALLGLNDCGQGNYAKPYASSKTVDDARKLLNDGKTDEGIAMLLEIVAERESDQSEEEYYQAFPILAAGLAFRGGFNFLGLTQSQSSGSQSLQSTMSQFVPQNPTSSQLEDMSDSISHLSSIPATLRSADSTNDYAASVILQLTLYQSAYAIMYINQFMSVIPGTDDIDLDRLQSMSDEDAARILDSLAAASQGGDSIIQTQLAATVAAIDQESGASRREKLVNYLGRN